MYVYNEQRRRDVLHDPRGLVLKKPFYSGRPLRYRALGGAPAAGKKVVRSASLSGQSPKIVAKPGLWDFLRGTVTKVNDPIYLRTPQGGSTSQNKSVPCAYPPMNIAVSTFFGAFRMKYIPRHPAVAGMRATDRL